MKSGNPRKTPPRAVDRQTTHPGIETRQGPQRLSIAPAANAVEFLYLDQNAVLAAGVLDMPRAMDAVGKAHALLAQGEVREPYKVVLRREETAESEARGRFNGLCAAIGSPPTAMGMKWIASFPDNRQQNLPRASALIILNCPRTGVPIAVMDGTLISAMRTGAMTSSPAR